MHCTTCRFRRVPDEPAPAAHAGAPDASGARLTARTWYRGLLRAGSLGLRAGWWLLAGQLVLMAAAGGLPVAAAWLMKLAFDQMASGTSFDGHRVARLVTAAALAAAAVVVTLRIAGHLATLHRRAIGIVVQDRLYTRVNGFVGLRVFEDPTFLGRLRLAEEAASGAPQALIGFGLELVQGGAAVLGFTGVLFALWPPMAVLLVVAAVPVVAAQLMLARRHAGVAESTVQVIRRRHFYQSLLTDVRAAQEVRLFGLAALFHRRLTQATNTATARALAVERRAAIVHSGLALLAALAAATGSVAVVLGAGSRHTTVGDLALFIAAVAGVQAAVAALASQLAEVTTALRLFEHYTAVVEAPDEATTGSKEPAPLRLGVELRDVWFRYRADGPWTLRGVSLFLPRGAAVGLVGVNGAGKSTLVKLICRFYEPERGEIRWDGVDIREFDVVLLRARLGATFQDFMAYDLSARENIGVGDLARMGDLSAIRRAARGAGVDETLDGLTHGYDTLLSRVFFGDEDGEPGAMLSGGQWQRVALARSLMRTGADLMILDEPSAGLDAAAEHHVHETLRAHRAGRTSLLISHRLSTLRSADVIAVLADGVIAELGDHDTLMHTGGPYARLFELQARGYQDSPVAPGGSG